MRCICCLSDKIVSRPIDKLEFLCCRNCGFVFKSKEKIQDPQKHIQYHYQYQDPHRSVAESKRLFFNLALSYLSKHGGGDKNILDVGCGYGYFLKMAANRGWMVKGVEITSSAARRSRELFGEKNIFHGLLNEANFPVNFFDAVTLWDVLVFVDDPFEDLKECYRIMKSKATIGLRVRNVFFQKMVYQIYSPIKNLGRGLGLKKPYIFHRYCFSASALEQLLRRVGFERIQITNSPLTHGDPYSHTWVRGGTHQAKKLVALLSDAIFKLSFGKCIIGPSLLVWARKP
jgi:SAM-dependent methyltransferase